MELLITLFSIIFRNRLPIRLWKQGMILTVSPALVPSPTVKTKDTNRLQRKNLLFVKPHKVTMTIILFLGKILV